MRIFVGLSGGVDSAVSAALLKEQGHDVTGVFIKIWSPEFLECTWREDRLDALRAAVALGISFREIDLSSEYHETVIKDMVANYTAGKTPNPDVLCNRTIKFGSFKNWALQNGAEAIATGHYAQNKKDGATHALLRGLDVTKDQSYFLYRLTEVDLSKSYFPVGGMTKKAVREKAREIGLPVAQKPDSQGLCFVGDVSMRDFLKRFIKVEAGAVLRASGETIGEHEGAALYTIGERHGFRVFNNEKEGPWFITKIDISENTITVSNRREDTLSKHATLHDLSFVQDMHEQSFDCDAVSRYRAKPVRAHVEIKNGSADVHFEEKTLVSAGQSVVLYDGERLLGGGVIV